jgi:hypothetical protein
MMNSAIIGLRSIVPLLIVGFSFAGLVAQTGSNDMAEDSAQTEGSIQQEAQDAGMRVNPELGKIERAKESDLKIRVVANGEELDIGAEELELKRDQLYDVQIYGLHPHTIIKVEFFKMGAKMGFRTFRTNHRGEFMFEYKTPRKKTKGKAVLTYVPENEPKVERDVQVKLR